MKNLNTFILIFSFFCLANSAIAQDDICSATAVTFSTGGTANGPYDNTTATVVVGEPGGNAFNGMPGSSYSTCDDVESPWVNDATSGGIAGVVGGAQSSIWLTITPTFTGDHCFNITGGTNTNSLPSASTSWDGELAVYSASSDPCVDGYGVLTELLSNDDDGVVTPSISASCFGMPATTGGGFYPGLCVSLTAGVTYYIQLDGAAYGTALNASTVSCETTYNDDSRSDNIELTVWSPFSATQCVEPLNDNCVDARTLECGTVLTGQTNVGADDDADGIGCATTGLDVWYTFTATQSETITVTATNETFDIEMGVVNASSCAGPFTDIGCGDDPETIVFTATAGQTYYIAVGGFGAITTGTFDIGISGLGCTALPSCADCTEPACATNPVLSSFAYEDNVWTSTDAWGLEGAVSANGTPIPFNGTATCNTTCTEFAAGDLDLNFFSYDVTINRIDVGADGTLSVPITETTIAGTAYQNVGGVCTALVPTGTNTYGHGEYDNGVTPGNTPGDPGSFDSSSPITVCVEYCYNGSAVADPLDYVEGTQVIGYGCTSIPTITPGAQSACNIADNTYTQDVVVTFEEFPLFSQEQITINGQIFTYGGTGTDDNPVTFTLTGLPSDGASVTAIGNLVESTLCTQSVTFTAPAACNCTPNAGTISTP